MNKTRRDHLNRKLRYGESQREDGRYRYTYCSNQAKSGMNLKTLQYLMGHSEIGVTLDVYTHLGLEDAAAELHRMEELQNARQEMNRTKDEAV